MSNKTEIYQLTSDAGILMQAHVVKTPNQKIIVIDGGNETYLEKPYLPSAIRAILGLNDGDYFEIEAWFLSHGLQDSTPPRCPQGRRRLLIPLYSFSSL